MTENSLVTPNDINEQWQPAIERHFRLQWEEAQNAFVLLYPEGMIKLNFSGGEILSRCDGQKSIADIIKQLQEKFPEAEGLQHDILEFFAVAYTKKWLTHD